MSVASPRTPALAQLELHWPGSPRPSDETPPPAALVPPVPRTADTLLETLRALGLRRIARCRLTRNRTVMVSFRGDELRVHEAYIDAPVHVLAAIVAFVQERGEVRRRARQVIVRHPVAVAAAPTRRERTHPDDALLVARLSGMHEELNARHFEGALMAAEIRVSRRMRSRLGSYHARRDAACGAIVISRRHVRRDGWRAVEETLLHEMVHQWQDERGLPLDHGRTFRAKARAVGITPAAVRRAPDVFLRRSA